MHQPQPLSKPLGIQAQSLQVRARAAMQSGQLDLARECVLSGLSMAPQNKVWIDLWLLVTPVWQQAWQGRRIALRLPKETDRYFFHACMEDRSFMQLFNPMAVKHRSVDAIGNALRMASTGMARQQSQHWLVQDSSNSRPLGLVSVVNLQPTHRRAELLVGFPDADTRGTGLATEAALLALDVCFNHAGLNKLTTLVFADNPHSQKSTEALGFSREGCREAHLRCPQTGNFLDCFENGLTESAFRANSRLAKLSNRLLARDITQVP